MHEMMDVVKKKKWEACPGGFTGYGREGDGGGDRLPARTADGSAFTATMTLKVEELVAEPQETWLPAYVASPLTNQVEGKLPGAPLQLGVSGRYVCTYL